MGECGSVVVEPRIGAAPATVFSFFSDVTRWGRWQGVDADVELEPDGDGTFLRLTHRGLPPDAVEIHRHGWEHYASRLVVVAEGGDPGPDPARARLGPEPIGAS